MGKKRRKCIAKPCLGVRYGACETCDKHGGKCPSRDKYERKGKKDIFGYEESDYDEKGMPYGLNYDQVIER